jgi:hypothetical protein
MGTGRDLDLDLDADAETAGDDSCELFPQEMIWMPNRRKAAARKILASPLVGVFFIINLDSDDIIELHFA